MDEIQPRVGDSVVVSNGNVITSYSRRRVRSLTKLSMSKVRKKPTADRLMIDELVANAKCGLRNISE